jgi:hypothetical protein
MTSHTRRNRVALVHRYCRNYIFYTVHSLKPNDEYTDVLKYTHSSRQLLHGKTLLVLLNTTRCSLSHCSVPCLQALHDTSLENALYNRTTSAVAGVPLHLEPGTQLLALH